MISQGKEEMGKMRKRTDGSAEETPKRGDGESKERNRSDFHTRHGAAWGHRRAPGTRNVPLEFMEHGVWKTTPLLQKGQE